MVGALALVLGRVTGTWYGKTVLLRAFYSNEMKIYDCHRCPNVQLICNICVLFQLHLLHQIWLSTLLRVLIEIQLHTSLKECHWILNVSYLVVSPQPPLYFGILVEFLPREILLPGPLLMTQQQLALCPTMPPIIQEAHFPNRLLSTWQVSWMRNKYSDLCPGGESTDIEKNDTWTIHGTGRDSPIVHKIPSSVNLRSQEEIVETCQSLKLLSYVF